MADGAAGLLVQDGSEGSDSFSPLDLAQAGFPSNTTAIVVDCLSSAVCFAAVDYGSAYDDDQGVGIYESWGTDSWSNITPVALSAEEGDSINALQCFSGDDSYDCTAVGSNPEGRLSITTTDSWSTYEENVSGESGDHFSSVSCTSADDCLAVEPTSVDGYGYVDEAYRLIGNSWSLQPLTQYPGALGGSVFNSVYCSTASWCIVLGQYYTPVEPPFLAESFDGGASWDAESLPSAAASYSSVLSGLACPSSKICFAVGTDSTGDHGLIIEDTSAALIPSAIPLAPIIHTSR